VWDVPLRNKFPRLFGLAVNQDALVEEMARLGWEDGGEAPFVSVGGGECEGMYCFFA